MWESFERFIQGSGHAPIFLIFHTWIHLKEKGKKKQHKKFVAVVIVAKVTKTKDDNLTNRTYFEGI